MSGNTGVRRPHLQAARSPEPEEAGSEQIGALIAKAEELYERRRYHDAITLCEELAAHGYSIATMTMIKEGCENAVRRRRVFRLCMAMVVAVAAAVLGVVWVELWRPAAEPPAGLLHLAELQEQPFAITLWFGRHRLLEYTWKLLDANGHPAPPAEQACLRPGNTTPWTCIYRPPCGVVRGGGPPAARRVVVTGADPSGRKALSVEWGIEVQNAPMPPAILSVEPPTPRRFAIPPGGARTFRLDALDGDGGKDLTYEWLVDGSPPPGAAGPAWTYAPPRPATPLLQTILCRVSNRNGEPQTQTLKWQVRVVPSNVPPQIIEIKPELRDYLRITRAVPLQLAVTAIDRDKDDALTYRWELDGAVVSERSTCTLDFPYDAAVTEKEVLLRLTVTDTCQATDQRTWRLVLVSGGL